MYAFQPVSTCFVRRDLNADFAADGGSVLDGLDALRCQTREAVLHRLDPVRAVDRFKAILAVAPTHYGGRFQLAKALDAAGQTDDATTEWQHVLRAAEAIGDEPTAAIARAHLAKRR